MVTLPDQYVVEKFCQYAGYPKYNKRSNVWTAGCPICREGSSWGKKRRLYYKLEKSYIFCFNCGWKSGTIDFVKHITGLTFKEILSEADQYDTNDINIISSDTLTESTRESSIHSYTLPMDSINLLDTSQINWWRDTDKVTQQDKSYIDKAVCELEKRKLNVAINRPKTFWYSLTDKTHQYRLVIPFYSKDNKIIFYQSRSMTPGDNKPKYMSKTGGDKSLFNINQIDPALDSIFIFEGPIDSCFVKNGIATAGITDSTGEDLNTLQKSQLEDYKLYQKIWVLDSQWLDDTSYKKSQILADSGANIFIWPSSIGKRYKDVNELCIDIDSPGIGHEFIKKHSYTGLKAKLLLNDIRSNR